MDTAAQSAHIIRDSPSRITWDTEGQLLPLLLPRTGSLLGFAFLRLAVLLSAFLTARLGFVFGSCDDFSAAAFAWPSPSRVAHFVVAVMLNDVWYRGRFLLSI